MARLYAPETGRSDAVMFWTTLTLLCLGMLAVYSSSAYLGAIRFGGSATFLEKQLLRAGIGLMALLFASRWDYRRWQALAVPLWTVSLGLLLMLVIFKKMAGGGMGEADMLNAHQVRGAWRWMHIGFVTLQPTEIAKVLTVMALASFLGRDEGAPRNWQPTLRVVSVVIVTVGLILMQPNFSSGTALLAVGGMMLLISGLPWQLMAGGAVLAPLAIFALLRGHGHHMERLKNYLALLRGDHVDMHGLNWQLGQSLVALGSGGLFGRGLGKSMQKFLFLPDPHTDFIFSIWGEEMGFIGAVALMLILALLLWRGFRTAMRAGDAFGFYLAAGLTLQLAVYAGVNIAVTTGFFPTTGLPLPFISFGGSSLVMNLFTVGILLNISRRARSNAA